MYKKILRLKNGMNSINVLSTRSQKKFRIHYKLRLKIARCVFSVAFYDFVTISLNFRAFCDYYADYRQYTGLFQKY